MRRREGSERISSQCGRCGRLHVGSLTLPRSSVLPGCEACREGGQRPPSMSPPGRTARAWPANARPTLLLDGTPRSRPRLLPQSPPDADPAPCSGGSLRFRCCRRGSEPCTGVHTLLFSREHAQAHCRPEARLLKTARVLLTHKTPAGDPQYALPGRDSCPDAWAHLPALCKHFQLFQQCLRQRSPRTQAPALPAAVLSL